MISESEYFFEDNRLAVGRDVTAYWADCGFSFQGHGQIVALNSLCVTVRLSALTGSGGECGRGNGREYREGDCIVLPRYSDQTCWSFSNRVRLGVNMDFSHKDFL
jgi:hypothetical protein